MNSQGINFNLGEHSQAGTPLKQHSFT